MSSTDKTKLDGIETGATADQTAAEIKTAYESNNDTNAFTDAEQTKLSGIEASADVTDATNVQAAGAVMDSELTDETAVKAIDQGLATTDSPTFANATTTGEVNVGTHIDLAVQNAHASYQEGRMWYDSIHKTVNFYSDNQNVIHEVGLEEHQRVYNSTGSTIAKGKPLYFAGNYTAGTIDVPTVGLADATDVSAYNAQGLAAADIPNNSYGYCIIAGQLDGLDTSALTAGTNFFVGLSPGAVQNASPTYPNYPMCLGWVVNSDATNGVLLVNQQNHSVNSFRVRTDAHIGDDLIVGGNLSVLGTTTTTSTSDVTAGAPFYRANEGDSIGEAGTTFTGSGLDDAFFSGHFTGTTSTTYYVKIDGTGTPDTFSVSTDNFATTISTGTAITGSEQLIHSADNIFVKFGATTGHTLNDVWTGTAGPTLVDTGFFSNRNTGTSGVGYTHMGLFYDVSTDKWTLLDEYDPTPSGTINLSDASTSYGLLKLDSVEGNLTGNVTGNVSGNATTATTLATSRSIGLGGDLSGSASFDGSADITITATVADNSHDHDNATTSADGFMSAADKTKLDGVETGATADQTAAEIEAIVSHDNLLDFVANEHIDWTTDQGATNIHINNVENATTSSNGLMSSTDKTKLDGIETGATADQTAAEIKTAYESNADTNEFSDALLTKLNGIEASADITDAINVEAAGAVMDGDFSSNGIMTRTGAGSYSITTDNTSNWDTAYSWGDHAVAGYLTAHPNISTSGSSNNSGLTFIQDVTLDSNGHVTALTTADAPPEFTTGKAIAMAMVFG
jgi:flagellar motor protein MotB